MLIYLDYYLLKRIINSAWHFYSKYTQYRYYYTTGPLTKKHPIR